MKTETEIKTILADAVVILGKYPEILAKNPDDLSAELSEITVREHIESLKRELEECLKSYED